MRYMDPLAPPGYWDSVNIIGELVRLTKKNVDSVNVTGKIVLYELPSGVSQEDGARQFKDSGILALLTLLRTYSDYPGAGNWVRDGSKLGDWPFPSYEISLKQNKSLEGWFLNQSRLIIQIGHDVNPWDDSFKYGSSIVGLSILVFSGIICIIASWKLTLSILVSGFQLSIAQVVLWMNVIGCILRMIWCATDPFAAFETTNFLFTQLMLSITYPFAVAGALLISLYWHELIKRTGSRINLFLDKMKWWFFGWSIFMLCFEVTTATLRGLYWSFSIMIFVDGAMYIVVSVAVLVFFIVTRYRLQAVFDRVNKGLQSRREQRLSLATFQLQVMVVLMVIWIILLVVVGATNLVWAPIAFPTIFAIFFLNLQLMCLLQVLLINAPRKSLLSFFCGLCRPELNEIEFTRTSTGPGSSYSGFSQQGGSKSLSQQTDSQSQQ
jgi:hypothetical protein